MNIGSEQYRLAGMDREQALNITRWRYPAPYSIYSMEGTDEEMAELMNGSYYYALDREGELAGYFCVGGSARVPGGYPLGIYAEEDCLDIGLGLRPDLTGQGLGPGFLLQVIAFVEREFRPRQLQLVVTAFNKRAIRAYLKAGFYELGQFQSMIGDDMVPFIAMRRNLKQNVLVTERLRLRPLNEGDAEDLFVMMQRDSDLAVHRVEPYGNVSQCIALINGWNNLFYRNRLYAWGITQQTGDYIIGWIGLEEVEAEAERANIRIYLSSAYRGFGIGHEALRAVTAYGLNQLGLTRLQALAEADHEAFNRLLESCGYKREGLLRSYVKIGDAFASAYMYAFVESDIETAEDWPPNYEIT